MPCIAPVPGGYTFCPILSPEIYTDGSLTTRRGYVRTGWFSAGKISVQEVTTNESRESGVAYEFAEPACSAQGRVNGVLLCLNDNAVYTAKRSYLSRERNRTSFREPPTPAFTSATDISLSARERLLTRVFPMGIVYLTS